MNREEIGPREIVIPEKRLYSCYNCKFYEHYMVSSGQHPVYESVCKKMNIIGDEIEDSKLSTFFFILSSSEEKTPDCCPYLKAIKRNDRIDSLL